jgi:hypothetical protein
MERAIRQLIEALHRANHRCVLALTGGGTGAGAMLLDVPGGARTVIEVRVPYQESAFTEFLAYRPEHFCSAPTARDMACRAYERAGWLAPHEDSVGVGCTASLVTDRPKRGDHRCHVAVKTPVRLVTYSVVLTKGARSRESEEAIVDGIVLNALAEAFGLRERLTLGLLDGEELRTEISSEGHPLERFFRRELAVVCSEIDGRVIVPTEAPGLVIPGAFNPVHEAHWGMAAAATRLTGLPVAFEVSVINVDKPAVTAAETRHRLRQFMWKAPVYVTRAPTFAEKADCFPGAVFALGADTAERIVMPRYYDNSEERMRQTLAAIRDRSCRFLVAGRVQGDRGFTRVEDLPIPVEYRDLFSAIPEAEFRLDVSSTEIRSKVAP